MEKKGAILSYQQLSGDKFPLKLTFENVHKALDISTYSLCFKK
jgi:hypothetical protein